MGKFEFSTTVRKRYIDRELMRQGVSPKDIIFGFRSPSIRKRLAEALDNQS